MKDFDIRPLIRPHLLDMKPYSSARDEFTGKSDVYLDANENALGSVGSRDLARYPDPHQLAIKEKLSVLKGVQPEQIFIGNGSDEPIDLLIRAFCVPGRHQILIQPPTYGMYEVSANVNAVGVRKVPLRVDYQLDVPAVRAAIDENTRLIFVCNPNNPTGTRINADDTLAVARDFDGLLVVDEAYIDFSGQESFISQIASTPNIVVLQTFSKAWGLAAARVGMLYAHQDVVAILNKIKPPYNVNAMSQEVVLEALEKVAEKISYVDQLVQLRSVLQHRLEKLAVVQAVYDSDANFLLTKLTNPVNLYHFLIEKGIIVRDRSKVQLCEGCLRITVGTTEENERLLEAMGQFEG
ncbi:MAG: histidinol-phosphate transaminase [Bacteroidota bacterium]